MTNSFRIGKQEFKLPRFEQINSDNTKQIAKLSKELEAARSEGKYARDATNVASELPREAYKIIEDYLRENNRKIYGGTAINMYLPGNKKIYKRGALPDLDFFSPEPWKDAVNLADLLYNAGYKYTETKGGLHKGTFKVFANFWPVADITYLPPDVYDQVTTTKHNGYTIVSPAYLQMTLYNLISKPLEAPVRWPNVAFRQKLLQKWSPAKFRKKQCVKDFIHESEHVDIDSDLQEALDIVYTEARKAKLLHGGALAYNKYVKIASGELRLPVYFYELFAQDAGKYARKFAEEISKISKNRLKPDIYYQPYKDMNNTSYILYMIINDEKVPIFSITELTRCIPYKYLGGRYYCAIDYLFYELYNQMFSEDTDLHSKDVSCLIRYLYYVQQRYYKQNNITELTKSPLQRFVTKCRGPYVDVVREEYYTRWVDQAKIRSKIVDIIPIGDTMTIKGVKGRKIRVYPKDLVIPDNCRNVSEEECNYPCSWVEQLNKCGGIPFTGYKPDQLDPVKVADNAEINLKGLKK